VRMESVELPVVAVAAAAPIAAPSRAPDEGLEAFAAEMATEASVARRQGWRGRALAVRIGVAALCVAVGAAVSFGYLRFSSRAARPAVLTIETDPSGLDVTIDGVSRGRTPLTLTLPPRSYEAVVGSGDGKRIVKATLAAGATVVQRLEMTTTPVHSAAIATILRVETEPSGRTIQVDGIARGVSPLTLRDLAPGEHQVIAVNGREPVARRISVRAGETTSLLLSAPAVTDGAVAAGWISVAASIPLQIREAGKLLGSTESERVMVPAGAHTIDVVNDDLGFSVRRAVNVAAGKLAAVRIDVPNGSLSLNAQPWAEVWVDGARVGETPIGNLSVPVGAHEVIFRHPDFGEQHLAVSVTVNAPARLSVDMRKK